VDEGEWLADRFEAHRTHLRAVAYQMLGSLSEADDAVQESWLRLRRSDRMRSWSARSSSHSRSTADSERFPRGWFRPRLTKFGGGGAGSTARVPVREQSI
jgi:hypothetical protein